MIPLALCSAIGAAILMAWRLIHGAAWQYVLIPVRDRLDRS